MMDKKKLTTSVTSTKSLKNPFPEERKAFETIKLGRSFIQKIDRQAKLPTGPIFCNTIQREAKETAKQYQKDASKAAQGLRKIGDTEMADKIEQTADHAAISETAMGNLLSQANLWDFGKRLMSIEEYYAQKYPHAGFNIYGLPESNETQTREVENGINQSKEIPWDDDNQAFLPASDAIKLADENMTLSSLSKLLQPEGPIRYMRKGQRCMVHLQDFRSYIKTIGQLEINEEAVEEFLEGVEKRKKEAHAKKQAGK